MVYDFLITLKKQNYRFADQVSQLMYFFALLAFGYFYYHSPKTSVVYLYIGGAILLFWLYSILIKQKTGKAYFRMGLFIAALGWFYGTERNTWMGILYVIAGLLEKQVKFPQEIGFSESEISFNTFPRKVLSWNEVNNALIKEGLITIDQKNNKLFQKEIEGYVTLILENEFNEFCRRCLQTAERTT